MSTAGGTVDLHKAAKAPTPIRAAIQGRITANIPPVDKPPPDFLGLLYGDSTGSVVFAPPIVVVPIVV